MSSSGVNVYNRSGELSCAPVTLADHCDTKEHSDGALREGKLTEKDLSLAKQMSIHTCILQLKGSCAEGGTE